MTATTTLPPIGSVWYRTLYPDRIIVVIAHAENLGKYGAVQIKRMDTGTTWTEPVNTFTWHHSPLETMETK